MRTAPLAQPVRVLITGASRGIGRATALRVAAPGTELALHYHTHASEAESLRREVEAKGCRAFLVGADLEEPEGARALSAAVSDVWTTVDGLVLNAGAYPRQAIASVSDEELDRCFRLNALAPARIVRDLLPRLRASPSGRVVLVSSVLAFTGTPHGAPYASAKAALLGLGRSLARELAPQTTVNIVAPGSIDTAILAGDTTERRAERNRSIPLGRVGSADDVAQTIAFLLAPQSAYITGATIHVNGGQFPA